MTFIFGTWVYNFCTLALNKGYFIDLLQGRDSRSSLLQSRLAQKSHPFTRRLPPDFRCGPLVQNHFPDPLAQVQQSMDRAASPKPRSAALKTARTLIKLDVAPLLGVQTTFHQI